MTDHRYKPNMSEQEVLDIFDSVKVTNSNIREEDEEGSSWLAVFIEKQNNPIIYEIILNGHGQKPLGDISKELFEKLQKDNLLSKENSYGGFKYREIYEFNV